MFAKYAEYYEILNQDKSYKKEIEFVYDWAKKPKWIFDIGCGTGNYWKYYPKDVQILGVEKSQLMIPKSKQIICADITEYKHLGRFDCATALFDVINYIPKHDWWKNLPLEKGGYFIFDIFSSEKVHNEGFNKTIKEIGGVKRIINPLNYDGKSVDLEISISDKNLEFTEIHKMYIYSEKDIRGFCGEDFKVAEIKNTKTWQQWWKIQKIR